MVVNYTSMNKEFVISNINVSALWGDRAIVWSNVDPKVNILVGPNGSGKSTFLRVLNSVLSYSVKDLDKVVSDVQIDLQGYRVNYYNSSRNEVTSDFGKTKVDVEYINTFDVPTSKKSKYSQLTQELDRIVYQHNNAELSFYDYRMMSLNYPEKRQEIEDNISTLFGVIDKFFKPSGKYVELDKENNRLIFVLTTNGKKIQLEQLSSGEKQLLIILFRVFLQQKKSYVLLMDEPEISLHIDWQAQLIDAIQTLNPNVQIILSTHSPSMFADGWGDKLVFMDEIIHTAKL